jgi:hypothetical protein
MKTLLRGALALACSLALAIAPAPLFAQHATTSQAPAGYAPEQACVTWSGGTIGSGSLIPCGSGGGGGGGGAATIADGADVAKGFRADASNCATDTTAVTEIAALKCVVSKLTLAVTALTSSTVAGEAHIGEVAGHTIIAGCGSIPCFTTTSATTAWASGQVIGDSATAGSVTKMQFQVCRVAAGTGMIRRARIKIASDTGFAGQPVVLYLYRDSPTLTNGDRGTWLTTDSNYIGKIPVTLNNHFSDYEKGIGLPTDSSSNVTEINYDCASSSQVIYGLLVAGGAITPQAGSKAVTVVLEALTN